jgi:hypothetical protein
MINKAKTKKEEIALLLLLFLLLFSCSPEKSKAIKFKIQNLTEEEYPDNPDIGFMSKEYDDHFLQNGELIETEEDVFCFSFFSESEKEAKIILPSIPIMEFLPSIPEHLKSNEYLSYLAVVNQEWNRNQVRLVPGEFTSTDERITRVDLARNCLNSYLWELIMYTEEDGKELPIAHAWFSFPSKLYKELFEKRNGVPFSKYKSSLLRYKVGESREVKSEILREITDKVPLAFTDLSDTMYPLKAARLKKYKEIITPKTFSSMRDLQVDETTLATFLPPGMYSKSDPRKTELGRLGKLVNAQLSKTVHNHCPKQSHELLLEFEDASGERKTKLVFGGLFFENFPKLSALEAHKGWKTSMGFSNHTFYETLTEHEAWYSNTNPYYGYLADQDNHWLDSHEIGIDGPIFYWDKDVPNLLHLWLLSFERHALVGHYTFVIP